MRLNVVHRTHYRYEPAARSVAQRLKLFPSRFQGQNPESWAVTANGEPVGPAFTDGYGDSVASVFRYGEVTELEIVAAGVVDCEDRSGVVAGFRQYAPPTVFTRLTEKTEPDDAIRALAAAVDEASANPLDRAHALAARVAELVKYVIGATSAATTAAEALAAGQGVCQDHAHVFVSALRSLGAPARYVSGYLFIDSDDPNAAAHAWAETWIADIGWVGFDPANGVCPTENYIRCASGLDARDAAPIRGSMSGAAAETMEVAVSVHQDQQ